MSDPRLFISTDMQMISGVNHRDGDKDDVLSLVHALMYQDKFDIVGIASSTSKHQPGANDARFIHHVLDIYEKDYAKLKARDADFKSADELRDIVYQGTKSLADGSGTPGRTAASDAIIREARDAAAAGEKLYVATWGGLGDVARALKDAPDIADDIRLLSASGPAQEPNAYRYIKEEFAGEGELWWVDAQTTQRGIYASPSARLPPMSNSWSDSNSKGHGALGTMFHENTIDLRGTGDTYSGVKMGDSWTVFYLIDSVNNNDPTASSWGGSYRKVDDSYWVDRTDTDFSWSGSNGAPTTYQHRSAWTNSFAERFDWLKSSGASTPTPEPTKPTPAPPTGDGQSELVVVVSGAAHKGDPKVEIAVNGTTMGTYAVSAERAAGEWQSIRIKGDWDQGDDHRINVTFVNNLYEGPGADRNIYVKSATLNGVTVGSETSLLTQNSSVSWLVDDALQTGGGGTGTGGSGTGTGGNSGDDVIVVKAAGNSYKGAPNFVISVDGKVIDADNKVTAVRGSGDWQTFVFSGDFDDAGIDPHKVQIRFDNDLYEGSGKDRNLVIDEVSFNGSVNEYDHTFKSNGSHTWDFLT